MRGHRGKAKSRAGLIGRVFLVTWGIFVRKNVEAEKLEPRAMREVQAEDKVVET
jgi:hypothetical protein